MTEEEYEMERRRRTDSWQHYALVISIALSFATAVFFAGQTYQKWNDVEDRMTAISARETNTDNEIAKINTQLSVISVSIAEIRTALGMKKYEH